MRVNLTEEAKKKAIDHPAMKILEKLEEMSEKDKLEQAFIAGFLQGIMYKSEIPF